MAADPVYAVELEEGFNGGQFNAGGIEVELTKENPRFETTDRRIYLGCRELPFLKDVGEVKKSGKASAE